jgi:hypothetical protein
MLIELLKSDAGSLIPPLRWLERLAEHFLAASQQIVTTAFGKPKKTGLAE